MLLWLWCRPVAAALIGPLAWELRYDKGMTLKKRQREKKTKRILTGLENSDTLYIAVAEKRINTNLDFPNYLTCRKCCLDKCLTEYE